MGRTSLRSFQVLAILAVSAFLGRTLPAQEPKLTTLDSIKALQAQYQAERQKLLQDGSIKRFLPTFMEKAEEFARRADKALADGRLLQASEGYRQARWQLPYQSPQVPAEHVSRVLGNMRLRHDGEINAIAFSPDGTLLASASRDHTVKIWDLGNGHEVRTYGGHGDAVRVVAFRPDGKTVASAGAEPDIKLWDPATAKDRRTLEGKGIYVTALVFTRDGKYLITGQASKAGTNNLMCIYETETGKLVRSVDDFRLPIQTINFSPDGTILAVGSGDGQIRLWDYPRMVDNTTVPAYWTQQDSTGATYHVIISPDNRTLARCGADGVKMYNLPQAEAKFQISSPRRVIPPPAPLIRYSCSVFGKDNKTLFTGGTDGVIRLFDAETGQPAGTFKGHNAAISVMTFNPAGSQLASASVDYTIRLWDFDIVSQARDYTGHDGPIWKTSFSPDGQRLVSASADRTVKVWDVGNGQVLHTLTGHRGPVTCAQFSPDGKFIASAGGDKIVKIWDASTGKHFRDLEGHQGTITALDWSGKSGEKGVGSGEKKPSSLPTPHSPLPAPLRLATTSVDRKIKIWDVQTGKELITIEDNGSVGAAVAFQPDGQQLAVGNIDQTIKLFDANSGKIQASWSGHGTAVSGLAYSPDGQFLASCGNDQLVRVWPLATPGMSAITLSGHNGPLSAVAFRKDGQHVASCGSDLNVKLWKLEPIPPGSGGPGWAGKEVQNYRGHREWVTSVSFSKDGFFLVSSGVDRLIKVWEITSREIPLLSEHTGAVQAVAISPDGKIIASGATDRTIKLWDRAAGVELFTLTGHAEAVTALVFTPDNKTLISASLDRTLKLWDVATGKELPRQPNQQQSWSGFLHAPPLIALNPDGKKLFVWEPGSERFAKINAYDLASGTELFTFNDTGRHVQAVSIAADGKTLATAAKDGSIRLFDLDKKGQMFPGGDWFLFEKDVGPGDIALTQDGATLVVSSDKGDLKICKVAGKEILKNIKAHEGHINACLISPDNKRIATAGQDNFVKLWDLATGQELRRWNMQGPVGHGVRGGLAINLAFSPDNKQLITGNANTTLFVLDLP